MQVESPRRAELPTLLRRTHDDHISLSIVLKKMKLEIIFMEWVEQVMNMNNYKFSIFGFECAFC